MPHPPLDYLADVYRHLPFLVFHVTTDGIILHCNPEACRVTGYDASELMARNLWATLFPGKLFAQVPKFISLVQPAALLKDMPMTIRTRQGTQRVIAFSRYTHVKSDGVGDAADSAAKTFICVGVDLTDRLLDADRAQAPNDEGARSGAEFVPFGPHIGNAGAIDGEFVTPIAISPRSPKPSPGEEVGPAHIEQVREGLARLEANMTSLHATFEQDELFTLGALGHALQQHELKTTAFTARADALHLGAVNVDIGRIRARLDEVLTLYRPDLRTT